MNTTINISLPVKMYHDAKNFLASRGYASISELIRDELRDALYPKLTENGFTPEFEDEIVRRASEPRSKDISWDGKGSFTDFVLTKKKKPHVKD